MYAGVNDYAEERYYCQTCDHTLDKGVVDRWLERCLKSAKPSQEAVCFILETEPEG
jgi:hypothetical protein